MTFLIEMIVNRGVGGNKFLQDLDVPEPGHCHFPSLERLVRVFCSIVEPTTASLSGSSADHIHRSPV